MSVMARRATEWRVSLARDVENVTERLLQRSMQGPELKRLHERRRVMVEVVRFWGSREGKGSSEAEVAGDSRKEHEEEDG